MIILTFATLLMFPVGAWALSFSNVAITDPGGVNRAKVDAKNNLNTAVHDAVSGVAAKVNSLGQQLGAVTGSVTANVAYPTSAIVHSNNGAGSPVVIADNDCASGSCTKLIAPPAGKALVITSIHVNTALKVVANFEFFRFLRSSNGTCSTASLDLFMEAVFPADIGLTSLQYDMPGGMTIPAGKALCILNTDPERLTGYVTAWGYAVASGAVPATTAAADAPTGAALLE